MADSPGLVSLLAERYPGLVERRALWLWAGGWDRAVRYEAPGPAWEEMWRAVLNEEGGTPDPLELVREALVDHPGEPVWLQFVDSQGGGADSAVRLEASILLDLMERLPLDAAFPETAVRALLAAFSRGGSLDWYAALAPALQGRGNPAFRKRLEAALAGIVAHEGMNPISGDFATRLGEHVRLLPPHCAGDATAADMCAELIALFSESEPLAASAAAGEPLQKLANHVNSTGDLLLISRVRVLIEQQRLVSEGTAGAFSPTRVVQAVQNALWGTTGARDPA